MPWRPSRTCQGILCIRADYAAYCLLGLVRQAPDIAGQHMQLVFGQSRLLRRHDVGLAFVDHLHDEIGAEAMQPDIVGRLGAPHRLIALAIRAVAGCAGHELLLPSAALTGSLALPDRLSTYSATLRTSSGVPMAAAIGGMTPMRPLAIVVLM